MLRSHDDGIVHARKTWLCLKLRFVEKMMFGPGSGLWGL